MKQYLVITLLVRTCNSLLVKIILIGVSELPKEGELKETHKLAF